MREQQVQRLVKAAFESHFRMVKTVRVNVELTTRSLASSKTW